jgi:PAS domain S-box-containing protein
MSSAPITEPLRETLAVFTVRGEPLTTPEVAQQLDIGRRSTYERLQRLAAADRLETKKVGASARVWWHPPSASPPKPDSTNRKGRPQRQFTEFESLVEAVDEYAIFSLNREGRIQTWNAGAERIKGYEADEVLGRSFSMFYTPADSSAGVPEQNLAAARHQESVEDEGWRIRADGSRFWADVTLTAIRDADGVCTGYIKVTRDMTEQRDYEQELRDERNLLEGIQEASPIGIGVFDTNGELLRTNKRFLELLGRGDADSQDYQLGQQPILDADGQEVPYPERPAPKALSTGKPCMDQRIRLDCPDGRTRWLSANAKPFSGATSGVVVTMADVTRLKEQAQQLERQRDELKNELEGIFERVDDGFYALDSSRQFTYVNQRAGEILGTPAGELIGEHIWEAFELSPEAEAAFTAAETTQRSISFTTFYEPFATWYQNHVHPSEDGISVYCQDVTERMEREYQLEQFERMIETVNDGVYATDGEGLFVFVNDAFVSMSPHTRAELLGAHGSAFFGDAFVDTDQDVWHELLDGTRDMVEFETDITAPDGQTRNVHNQFVLLDTGSETGRVGVTRDITERKDHLRELEDNRQQLAALNSLNEVVSEITNAVISQSTREEIEQTVCEYLAAADSYQFSWIGEADTNTKIVSLRAEAGVEGYLDDITISVDPTDERSHGPTGKAFRTGRIQTTGDLDTDARYEPWRGRVESYGWRSSAAIPIAHDGTIYGVLNVYADRPRAFEQKERDVIAQLGEVVGHAIAATERKQALMSDEVTELAFSAPTMLASVGVSDTDGRITFDYAVPTGNEAFLQYGTVDTAALPTLEALVERLPHFEAVRIIDDGVETARFELRLSAPPVVSVVASHGGYVHQSAIESGEFRMTIHLPTTVTARRVIDAVREAYPTARLLRRRQITRSDETLTRVHRVITQELTDRQRAVLETAVYSGFFNWPRDASGAEIATTLGVSAPTFHQHLRIAQRKLFESVFSVPAST